MALLSIGINENLKISNETKINDKGTLELVIQTANGGEDALMAAFETGASLNEASSKFMFFPPMMKTFKGAPKTNTEVAKDLLAVRFQLELYASPYASKEKVKDAIGGFKMFAGIGIPEDATAWKNALNMLAKEEFARKIHTNLCTRFVTLLQEVNAFNSGDTFRQKLVRQSADKNFAAIPRGTDIWLEPMTIAIEDSKIAFTQYEIDKKMNSSADVKADGAKTSKSDAAKAEDLFAAPVAPPASDAPAFGGGVPNELLG